MHFIGISVKRGTDGVFGHVFTGLAHWAHSDFCLHILPVSVGALQHVRCGVHRLFRLYCKPGPNTARVILEDNQTETEFISEWTLESILIALEPQSPKTCKKKDHYCMAIWDYCPWKGYLGGQYEVRFHHTSWWLWWC